MSKGSPGSDDKTDDRSPETSLRAPLGRRLFIFKASAILSGVAAFGFGRSAHGQTDFDVTDHGPKGKKGPVRGGVTDKDPDDPEGGGQKGRPRRTSGVTDKDPSDPEGGGRGSGGGQSGGGGRGPDRK